MIEGATSQHEGRKWQTLNFKNRIVGEEHVAPDQLLANPMNFRRHPKAQVKALEGALDEIGWIQRVIVNKRTGHLIDGHARVELALGRGENLLFGNQGGDVGERILAAGGGTSIFDPVLCEVAYRWYAPPGGRILDPFAGGSVRGVVAAVLGYDYTGIDLRQEQVEANQANWSRISNTQGDKP